jgi:transglutaminase-like putative cysteine protease
VTRRPRALVAPGIARLAAFALLATVGSLQWVRYVEGASTGRALEWAAAATVTAALVLLAGRRPLALAGAVVAGAALAVAASGLDLTYLEPKHLDELGAGLARGAEALNAVRLPYLGQEPWVLRTVQLAGAGLCWLAALLACWPGGRGRIAALIILLTLSASPIISLGADKPTLLGLGLAALTAAFLWLERLARRPGLGLAAFALAVTMAAVPLGAAADREEPWFDYRAFSEKLAGGTPVTFNWDHEYGPIDWTREGVELFRVRSEEPHYWKVETLNEFDGRLWSSQLRHDLGNEPSDDLPAGERRKEWDTSFSVSLSRLETEDLVGSGTTLEVTDATQDVEPGLVPGQWEASDGKALSNGDSYTVLAHVPAPTPQQLNAATVGRDPRRGVSLLMDVDVRPDAIGATPRLPAIGGRPAVPALAATVAFRPFESGRPPVAEYRTIGRIGAGARALRNSYYDRTWELAQRLKHNSLSPYEYVLAVNSYLRGSRFEYTEVPPPAPAGEAPLEFFLFDSQRGYCQQYSGAMALLLRMGGVPARVATGFSPGGLRASTGEWVVRDTDAHSWVEAWFDGIGWVVFDPTPPQTPARSLIAAIAPPLSDGGGDAAPDASGPSLDRKPSGPPRGPLASDGAGVPGSGGGGDGTPWVPIAAAAAAAALLLFLLRRRAGRSARADAALLELERALRRLGRPAAGGTTLTALERSFGVSGDGYLDALRSARYRADAAPPTARQRAEFRRALARAAGPGGRIRALYALPPTLRRNGPR